MPSKCLIITMLIVAIETQQVKKIIVGQENN